ncbi:MAG: amino acid adenylation domain-containing protein [Cellvibrio sp.]|uniref:amino acid adenylation domain-containing protein n=1 Tax=Cellvibrio sp. TaxID=1965322 RepID=UPI002719E490|nr:amino acid adenylation domain-containing protein [Cellvibrio sp.]
MQAFTDRIAHWAQVQTDTLAVNDGGQSLSFGQLHARAREIAWQLQILGVAPRDRVMILLPKSADAVAAIVGVLLTGATYVPIDTSSPKPRLQSILEDCKATVLIVNQQTMDWFPAQTRLNIAAAPSASLVEAEFPVPDMNADAYVLYTSGSTGVPNGVQISQRAMHSFFHAVNCYMGIDHRARCMNTSALYFDVSIADLLLPLYQGASVWLGPSIPLPFRFIDIITSNRITHFCAVGSTLTMLAGMPDFSDHQWSDLRCIMTGAEVLNPNSIASWLRNSPNAIVLNGYGPTETTCVCTVFEINQERLRGYSTFPIGKPLPGIGVFIDTQVTDDTDCGELCISGAQVMTGYLKRATLNDMRLFVHEGDTFYRTGDKVRYNQHGELIFLGRIDDQVKINSYRIDLGEVVTPFRNTPGIEDAIAVPLKHPERGECLGVVVKLKTATDLLALKNRCNDVLPAYMRAAFVAEVGSLPLSPSGKVNVRKLRAIASAHFNAIEAEVSRLDDTIKEQEC